MKLKLLNIIFKDLDDFFDDVNKAMRSEKGRDTRKEKVIIFDSIKTFNNLMTVNKLQLLRVISQMKPESVYQLAMILCREPHHVLKDCRHLEAHKFILLEDTQTSRNSLRPVLTFNYDVIKTSSPIVPVYPISKKSEEFLFLGRSISLIHS